MKIGSEFLKAVLIMIDIAITNAFLLYRLKTVEFNYNLFYF